MIVSKFGAIIYDSLQISAKADKMSKCQNGWELKKNKPHNEPPIIALFFSLREIKYRCAVMMIWCCICCMENEWKEKKNDPAWLILPLFG